MSEAVAARDVRGSLTAWIAVALAITAVVLNLVASLASVDDLYLPAMVLGIAAIGLGVHVRRASRSRLGLLAIVLGAWAPATTLVYLVVVGLQELF